MSKSIVQWDIDEATYVGDENNGAYFQVGERKSGKNKGWYVTTVVDAFNATYDLVEDDGPYETQSAAEAAGLAEAQEFCLRSDIDYRSDDQKQDDDANEEIHGEVKVVDEDEWVTLCKRTNYPKLGYIIHRLNEEQIPCRFSGESWHADHILEVQQRHEADAWAAVMNERHGRYALDDVRDNHPKFLAYSEVQPSIQEVE